MKNTYIILLINSLVLAFTFTTQAKSPEFKYKCEEISKLQSTVWLYCDLSIITPEAIPELKKIAQYFFDSRSNQVHLKIFNNRTKTPKSYAQQQNMSDKDLDTHWVVDYAINKNSNYRSFYCKKKKAKSSENCYDML